MGMRMTEPGSRWTERVRGCTMSRSGQVGGGANGIRGHPAVPPRQLVRHDRKRRRQAFGFPLTEMSIPATAASGPTTTAVAVVGDAARTYQVVWSFFWVTDTR